MNGTTKEQAIALLREFLTAEGQLGKLQVLEAAVAHNRVVNTTGNGQQEGVSVMTWHLPRLQLVGELKEESWGLRGEAPIEILTLSTPVESMPVDPGNIPPGQLKKLVPATTPVSYQSATAEEVAALPGADVFLPALQQLLIDKAILALQPDEPTPPPEENPA